MNTKHKRSKRKKEKKHYLKDIIEKRYIFLVIIIVIMFVTVLVRLFQVQILNLNEYKEKLASVSEKLISGTSAPRGRIYDRNYNLLVDNVAVKTIYYKKIKGIKVSEEIELAYKIGSMIEIDYSKQTESDIKNFWLVNNTEEAKARITKDELKKYEQRKLTDNDIRNLQLERITKEDLDKYTDVDKEASYIYSLMNKGYSYDDKIIKNENVLEEEYALISENASNLKGFNTKLDWERIYLYGDTFKSILGRVSSDKQGIPAELKDYYLKKGYALNDRVGISYIEEQYEDYLKGIKPVYKLLSDNSFELVSEGIRGNDIVLSIDINLQQEVDRILEEEVINTKKEPNTEYYNRSFVVITDPKSGEILAMSGKQVQKKDDGSLYVVDYTPGILTLPVTPGSIVKGASISVGYKYGAIQIGEYLLDECLKIKATPIKCSWRTMGNINDLTAIQLSSNVYQFKIAIRVGGGHYVYDQALPLDPSAFDKYRDMYAEYGLGIKTKIDLPVESLGYRGTSKLSGHLLDFSIGQYDTYTPIQLAQYMNTLANGGSRLQPHLLKEVYAPSRDNNVKFGDLVYKFTTNVLGRVDLEQRYMDRIREELRAVMIGSVGWGYMGNVPDTAGKTGTSQSFIDTNDDGVVDMETESHTFAGYYPYYDPKMSITVISPDVSHMGNGFYYSSGVNRRISSRISNKFFEIYR